MTALCKAVFCLFLAVSAVRADDYFLAQAFELAGRGGIPTDYANYWHPSKYGDGIDRGTTDASDRRGVNLEGVSITTNGWFFPATGNNGIYTTFTNSTSSQSIICGTNYTYSLWIQEPSTGIIRGEIISSRREVNDTILRLTTDGLIFAFANDGTFKSASAPIPEIGGNYLHLAYTVDSAAGTIILYFDGKPVSTNTTLGIANSGSKLTRFGNQSEGINSNDLGYRGYMDNLKFYRRVLSKDEVAELYKEGR
jgi:hypothetical protein